MLVKQSRAPAVSPLVIEKQHQLLLRDDALRRVGFGVQRVALLETKYNALVAEARFLLAQRDSVCNVLQPADGKTRIKCDTLTASLEGGKWTCKFELKKLNDEPGGASPDCGRLALTWGQGLREGTSTEKRALWEAIAALGGRLAIARPMQDEADFRLAHLSHLEVAASDEFAIRAQFEDTTLFDSDKPIVRFFRRLLHPFLKLLFNPNVLSTTLHKQAAFNQYVHAHQPLQFELLHNLVLELTRASIEVKNLKMRLESVQSRLEFNERRARALEAVVQYKPEAPVRGGRDDSRRDQQQRFEHARGQGAQGRSSGAPIPPRAHPAAAAGPCAARTATAAGCCGRRGGRRTGCARD